MNLFFYSDKQFDDVATIVFMALGITNYLEGESSNVLGGYYYSYSVFGVEIKLERNSYDYEDQFNFMIHIKERSINSLKADSSIGNTVSSITLKMLYDNLKMPMGFERGNELIIVSDDNIFEIIK